VYKILFLLASLSLLSACNGNSSSESSQLDVDSSPLPAGTLCTSKETLTIKGIDVQVSDFDIDNNGCLYPEELSKAYQFADEQAALQLESYSLYVDGTNLATSTSKIIKARVIGSSEVSNQLIQLHSGINDGRFLISVEINALFNEEESLRIFFDDSSYQTAANTSAPNSFDVKPPMEGLITVVVNCEYQNDFKVYCYGAAAYPTGDLSNDTIQSALMDTTYNLDWTFSEMFLPQAGNIIITYCSGTTPEAKCFNNFVEIGTAFN
jgi:hypothetical protein